MMQTQLSLSAVSIAGTNETCHDRFLQCHITFLLFRRQKDALRLRESLLDRTGPRRRNGVCAVLLLAQGCEQHELLGVPIPERNQSSIGACDRLVSCHAVARQRSEGSGWIQQLAELHLAPDIANIVQQVTENRARVRDNQRWQCVVR